jgi:hypothetical protein
MTINGEAFSVTVCCQRFARHVLEDPDVASRQWLVLPTVNDRSNDSLAVLVVGRR